MLDLQFTPYRTEIRAGRLDLSPITTGEPDAEYVLIRLGGPMVFCVADEAGFTEIWRQFESRQDTVEGREKARIFLDASEIVPAKKLGRFLCRKLPRPAASVPVLIEPQKHSIKVTLLPEEAEE